MKKAVMNFIASLGGTSSYAGNTEKWTLNAKEDGYNIKRNLSTLFINDPAKAYAAEQGKPSIKDLVLQKFGNSLPFTLKTN